MADWTKSYDPDWVIDELLEETEHGKPAMEVLRHAIQEADRRQDLPFMFTFRVEFCRESTFYGDGLELMVVFPELLALSDRHPGQPDDSRYVFQYQAEHVMWIYKWVLDSCMDFYQISMEDCKRFFEDYRKRCVSMGLSLRNYYCTLYSFYAQIDESYSEECFHKFEKSSRDAHSDCKTCERNVEIKFYLDRGDLKKAERLSKDIENFRLTCGSLDKRSAWLRMKIAYMNYYLDRKEYEKAQEYARLVERYMNGESEYECWEDFLVCYAHTNIGKALKIYKEHWKEWMELRCPMDSCETERSICIFFKELGKARKGGTVKIHYGPSFPLYREDGQYKITELFDFHYSRAKEIAEKFDQRNGTDYYRKKLEESLHEDV